MTDDPARDIFNTLTPGTSARVTLERELDRRAARFEGKYGTGRYYYSGLGDFVREHGQLYQGVAWPMPEPYKHLQGRQQWCYSNALKAALADRELRYCEGLYSTGTSATEHAWCLAPDDTVIEFTLPIDEMAELGVENSRIKSRHTGASKPIDKPEHWVYYGVVFDTDWRYSLYTALGWDLDHASVPVLDDGFPGPLVDPGDSQGEWRNPDDIFKRPWRPT